MLKWALIFLLIAIVAGLLGFSNISAGAATIAKILFVLALVIFVAFVAVAVMVGKAVFCSARSPPSRGRVPRSQQCAASLSLEPILLSWAAGKAARCNMSGA